MAFTFKLPDLGEGVAEGEIVKWLVKESDRLDEDQPMVEVMTDKATVEIPAPRAGTVLTIMAKEGQVIKVGDPVVVLGEAGEAAAAKGAVAPGGNGAGWTTATAPSKTAVPPAAAPTPGAGTGQATPAVRKLARELGVDLAAIQGSGPNGRITEQDVKGTAGSKGVAAAPSPSKAGAGLREERQPVRGLRKKIAEKMVKSAYTAPQVTHMDECDMTHVVALKEKISPSAEKEGLTLTYLPFIIKAVASALREFPALNASYDDATGEIVFKRYYNIGIAVATDEGLTVPNIKDADRKTLLELAREIDRVAKAARSGHIALEDLQDGTFTITNMGAIGGLFATPLVNHPEVAILGIHRIQKRPVVRDDQIVIREMMNLSLSFDHRVTDGAVVGRFVNKVKEFMENPALPLFQK